MPCEMHVGTECHSINVCLKIEQMGTSEMVLRFDVGGGGKGKKLHFPIFLLLRKSLVNRKHTEIATHILIVRETIDTKLF
jgi:hypothetical protein